AVHDEYGDHEHGAEEHGGAGREPGDRGSADPGVTREGGRGDGERHQADEQEPVEHALHADRRECRAEPHRQLLLRHVGAGEFARAYVAQQQLPVRFSTALASVGVERALDGLLLAGLLTPAGASPAFPGLARIGTTSVSGLATGAAVFFGAVLVVAVLVVHRPAPWLGLLRRVTHALLPARFAGRLTQVAEGLVAGLEVLKSPTRFVGVVAWSLLQWLVNAAAFAVCFRAFGLPVPPEGAFLLQGIIGFGVALPASPGFVGVFEAATRVTLAIYGIDATRAVSYAVAY